VLEKPVLAVACCVDNNVYVAAGFNCSLVLQVADSYPLSASRVRTNEELALLGAALIGQLTDRHKNGGWRKTALWGFPQAQWHENFFYLLNWNLFS
jgi:hypothetical protein